MKNLQNFTSLKKLCLSSYPSYLDRNYIKSMSKNLLKLTDLVYLDLSNNLIPCIKNILTLTKVEHLDLSMVLL